jgi:hypothetical protein
MQPSDQKGRSINAIVVPYCPLSGWFSHSARPHPSDGSAPMSCIVVTTSWYSV